MKKFNATLATAVIALSSVFGFTSCNQDDCFIPDQYEEPSETPAETYNYNAKGLWRFDDNGEKYTLSVDVPNYDTGGSYCANFYYNGQCYTGRAQLKNNIMTFNTDSESKLNVVIKATFANNDSQKFTAEMSIDNNTVSTDATFTHLDDPHNIKYSISYNVVDPDNELAAMGVDIQKLIDGVKQYNDETNTGNQRKDTAFGSLTALLMVQNYQVSKEMQKQCNKYPDLNKTKVYVEISVVETLGDINTDYPQTSLPYESIGK